MRLRYSVELCESYTLYGTSEGTGVYGSDAKVMGNGIIFEILLFGPFGRYGLLQIKKKMTICYEYNRDS